MEEPTSPAPNPEPNADRIAELEQRLALTEQRYAASSEEGKRLAQQVQALSRPAIPDRRASYEEQLETLGIPMDALDHLVNDRATKVVERAFQPIAQGIQARTAIVGEYPDYNKHEAEVARYIGADPALNQRYQNMFSADPGAAMEFAYLKYGEHQRRTAPSVEDQTKGRKVDASIPGSRAGDSRGVGVDRYEEAKREAKEHYNKTGDPSRLSKVVYGRMLRDEFLNQ